MAIKIDQLANEIVKELGSYTSEVKEKVEIAKKEVAKISVKELKSAGIFKNLTGDYRKGWRTKKVKNHQVVHNATDYQLTHLLEKGHVNRDGTSRSKKFPHIALVEEQAVRAFENRVEKAIRP